jgi:deazaflavin-dependent oxidoreductase (nitroreductase family)
VLIVGALAVSALVSARRRARRRTGALATATPNDRAMLDITLPPWLGRLLRAPAWLYRHDLGWLLGRRALLLVHRGRTSGRVYATVLEVVRYDPATHESVVVAALGARADWYRNIQAQPAIEVRTGRERYQPRVRELPPEEHFAVVDAYVRGLPFFVRPLVRKLGFDVAGTETQRRAHAARLLLIGFRPAPSGAERDSTSVAA